MCNLNLLFKVKQPFQMGEEERIKSFLWCATAVSHSTNSDADGLYFNNGEYARSKEAEKLDTFGFNCVADTFITHQRIATSGISPKYHQPIKKDEFVLVHNGVLSEYTEFKQEESDTFRFMNEWEKEFNNLVGDREQRIIQALKTKLDKQTGSYSILLHDITTNKSYYVKNDGTFIHAFYNGTYLFITTKEANKVFLKLLRGNEFEEHKVSDYTIFRIEPQESGIEVTKIGEVEEAERIKYTVPKYDYSINKILEEDADHEDKMEQEQNKILQRQIRTDKYAMKCIREHPERLFYEGSKSELCFYCEQVTKSKCWANDEHVCIYCREACITELIEYYDAYNEDLEELTNGLKELSITERGET